MCSTCTVPLSRNFSFQKELCHKKLFKNKMQQPRKKVLDKMALAYGHTSQNAKSHLILVTEMKTSMYKRKSQSNSHINFGFEMPMILSWITCLLQHTQFWRGTDHCTKMAQHINSKNIYCTHLENAKEYSE